MERQFCDYDHEVNVPAVPKNYDAKARWVIPSFRDPDIAVLNRTVPTPWTEDVPLSLQCISPIETKTWVGDA
eukprot:2327079-Pyramimonas_sp.AAC.1